MVDLVPLCLQVAGESFALALHLRMKLRRRSGLGLLYRHSGGLRFRRLRGKVLRALPLALPLRGLSTSSTRTLLFIKQRTSEYSWTRNPDTDEQSGTACKIRVDSVRPHRSARGVPPLCSNLAYAKPLRCLLRSRECGRRLELPVRPEARRASF